MNEYGTLVEWYRRGNPEAIGQKSVPVARYLPQILRRHSKKQPRGIDSVNLIDPSHYAKVLPSSTCKSLDKPCTAAVHVINHVHSFPLLVTRKPRDSRQQERLLQVRTLVRLWDEEKSRMGKCLQAMMASHTPIIKRTEVKCAYDVTLRRVHVTTVAVEKQ